jgi:hypothetical protein
MEKTVEQSKRQIIKVVGAQEVHKMFSQDGQDEVKLNKIVDAGECITVLSDEIIRTSNVVAA